MEPWKYMQICIYFQGSGRGDYFQSIANRPCLLNGTVLADRLFQIEVNAVGQCI